ncbi:phosphate ABC transporter, periplasmic phosphate-binding protein [Luminiphilus syltensis NOR5-1B]|uniref:Phosphate ABC transporter, periplasmic phosphate-binding protein n=1 Tax=Luminiphilus syltensis NOR5-1B TaxID=565045 RepID=B8KRT5_9GAMM|nr:phosphate ABC transporter, periplasmic phosphate-binding protein [Luminiphilus syltensis NOR5-1B]
MLCAFSSAVAATTVATPEVRGNLIITGSDTLAALVSDWADAFVDVEPGVTIEIQAMGSASAPPALTAGSANLGSMSRQMTRSELDSFFQQRGWLPTAVPIAVDTIAIIVHPDNPLESITLDDLDSIYSANHACSGKAATHWADLGVAPALGALPVERYGRTSISGTYGFFRERALCRGDFAAGVNALPGSAAVVSAVSQIPTAIGYTSMGFITDQVKVLPIVSGRDTSRVQNYDADGSVYPLSRTLWFYLAFDPQQPPPRLECAFLQFIASTRGRELLRDGGFEPVDSLRSKVDGALTLAEICNDDA